MLLINILHFHLEFSTRRCIFKTLLLTSTATELYFPLISFQSTKPEFRYTNPPNAAAKKRKLRREFTQVFNRIQEAFKNTRSFEYSSSVLVYT